MKNIKLRHYESKDYISPLKLNQLQIKLEVICGSVKEIRIKYWKRFKDKDYIIKSMDNYSIESNSPYYEVVVESPENLRYLNYYFIVTVDDGEMFFSRDGLGFCEPIRFFEYQYINGLDCYKPLNSFEGRVGYQIFIDRFFRVESTKNIDGIVKWNSSPTRENFFGGNLRGVIQKLNYLKDLGVSVLIFMPIFKSISNHKYDTVDYLIVDPSYGSLDDLRELVRKAHDLDIKIILDGVFNHIGYYSDIFQNVLEKGVNSKYYNWFIFNESDTLNEDLKYLAVGDYKWMPKLNYESLELREFIINVCKYWIDKCNIDGWRFDVFDEIPEIFRIELSKSLKEYKNDIFLIAETWHDGYELMANNQVDSVMNYLYRNCIIDYFIDRRINSIEFKNRLEWLKFRYPSYTENVLYNLLGSHDTTRIMTLANNNFDNILQAYVFLLTTPGMPVIYYGDELGMTGEVDPDCRKAMVWNEVGNKFNQEIKDLIRLRNNSLALKLGDIKHFIIKGIFGYIRSYEKDVVIVLFNTLNEDTTVDLKNINYFDKYILEEVFVKKNGYEIINL
ncbi:MAG: glycoside hydrolase family 13 protein [Candidatus Izemoplasmatales bacterium]